tara:strand:- start:8973 stop:9701 length:729 start_codon:yes stop_codon:yes gene_type:complete
MKKNIYKLFKRYPSIFNPIWENLIFPLQKKRYYSEGFERNLDEVFKKIYENGYWDSQESLSGPGSELEYTLSIRKQLPLLLEKYKIYSLLDAPCGDCNWISKTLFKNPIKYIGGDIVDSLISEVSANVKFDSKFVTSEFKTLDIVKDQLPHADMWLCRDVLFHLPTKDVINVIENFKKSSIEYLLTTNFYFQSKNLDTKPGGFRFLNLHLEPYDLPKPLAKISDFIVPYPPRYLCLYHKSQF